MNTVRFSSDSGYDRAQLLRHSIDTIGLSRYLVEAQLDNKKFYYISAVYHRAFFQTDFKWTPGNGTTAIITIFILRNCWYVL